MSVNVLLKTLNKDRLQVSADFLIFHLTLQEDSTGSGVGSPDYIDEDQLQEQENTLTEQASVCVRLCLSVWSQCFCVCRAAVQCACMLGLLYFLFQNIFCYFYFFLLLFINTDWYCPKAEGTNITIT